MTTPSYGKTGGVFTVCAQSIINSPPSTIYEVLLDFTSCHLWNSFVYAVDLPPNITSAQDVSVRMGMVFHTSGVLPGFNTTSDEIVRFLESDTTPPYAAWDLDAGALVEAVMQAEHPSLMLDLGNGSTRYVSWETYYGLGAVALLALQDNLRKQFEIQAEDLKARVEGLQD